MLYFHLFSRWQVPLAADRGAAGTQPGVQRSVPAVQVQNNASSDTPGSGQLICQRADHRWVTTGPCPVSRIIGEIQLEHGQCLVSQVSHNRNLSSVLYHRWDTTGTCPVSRIIGESQQDIFQCLASQVSHNRNVSSVCYDRWVTTGTCPVSRITGESQQELVQCLVCSPRDSCLSFQDICR